LLRLEEVPKVCLAHTLLPRNSLVGCEDVGGPCQRWGNWCQTHLEVFSYSFYADKNMSLLPLDEGEELKLDAMYDEVAELIDVHDSGSCEDNPSEVRAFSSALVFKFP
jgi:hypothetical protein